MLPVCQRTPSRHRSESRTERLPSPSTAECPFPKRVKHSEAKEPAPGSPLSQRKALESAQSSGKTSELRAHDSTEESGRGEFRLPPGPQVCSSSCPVSMRPKHICSLALWASHPLSMAHHTGDGCAEARERARSFPVWVTPWACMAALVRWLQAPHTWAPLLHPSQGFP